MQDADSITRQEAQAADVEARRPSLLERDVRPAAIREPYQRDVRPAQAAPGQGRERAGRQPDVSLGCERKRDVLRVDSDPGDAEDPGPREPDRVAEGQAPGPRKSPLDDEVARGSFDVSSCDDRIAAAARVNDVDGPVAGEVTVGPYRYVRELEPVGHRRDVGQRPQRRVHSRNRALVELRDHVREIRGVRGAVEPRDESVADRDGRPQQQARDGDRGGGDARAAPPGPQP